MRESPPIHCGWQRVRDCLPAARIACYHLHPQPTPGPALPPVIMPGIHNAKSAFETTCHKLGRRARPQRSAWSDDEHWDTTKESTTTTCTAWKTRRLALRSLLSQEALSCPIILYERPKRIAKATRSNRVTGAAAELTSDTERDTTRQ